MGKRSQDRKLILDLCGGTGRWSQPYAERLGEYEVRVITLPHYDVRLFEFLKGVYGILAAPVCTDLAGSGARWWAQKGERALLEALALADACARIVLVTKPKFWALENPVGRLRRFYGPPKLIFQPNQFGDPYQKRTLIWGDFNIPEFNVVSLPDDPKKRRPIFFMKRTDDRPARRALTPSGFARAFFEANR